MCIRDSYEPAIIRSGCLTIDVLPFSQVTFFIKTSIVFKYVSLSAKLIHKSSNIWESNSILLNNGFKTELDFEIKKHLISLEDTKL